jgi:sulfur carrier protein
MNLQLSSNDPPTRPKGNVKPVDLMMPQPPSQNALSQISVVVNGQPQKIPDALTLPDLLDHLGVDPQRVAIELNGAIIRRPDWNQTTIHSGCELEIVQFVGGG